MLSPVFDEAAGLMPVLVEDSDESISSPEQSPTKPVMVLKRPHIDKKLSCQLKKNSTEFTDVPHTA